MKSSFLNRTKRGARTALSARAKDSVARGQGCPRSVVGGFVIALCLMTIGQPGHAASGSVAVLPLFFEPANPSNSPARFLARGPNYQFFITPSEASLVLRKVKSSPNAASLYDARASRQLYTRVARMRFLDANPQARLAGTNQMPGLVNYLIGNDPVQWRTGVPTYASVRVQDLYPGIDAIYYGNNQQLEYDFVVAPGADAGLIRLRFDGVNRLSINPTGELVIKLGTDEIRQPAPELYQVVAGNRRPVSGGYQLEGRTVRFKTGDYDHSIPLRIDPLVTYSSYFGGNYGDEILGVKLGTNGAVYVAGETVSTSFGFPLPPGGFTTTFQGGRINGDAFIAKFDSTGSNLIYFTYLGGIGNDGALDLAVDSAGRAFVTGFTDSTNFPVANALFPKISGKPFKGLKSFQTDAFVTELNETGSALVYSTYLGGGYTDRGIGIALDSSGAAFVTGFTASTNFPVTASAYQSKLAGSNDVFVTRLAPGGSALLYSTYLGGTNIDEGQGIALDPSGLIYITGYTGSTNFPVSTNALQTLLNQADNPTTKFKGTKRVPLDGFVARLDPFAVGASSLLYSTLLGGTNNDAGFRIALDFQTNVYIAGNSSSLDFLNTNHLVEFTVGTNKNHRVNSDGFLTKLSFSSGPATVQYSALFGGTTNDTAWGLAIAPSGEVFVTGITTSSNFPIANVTGPLLRYTNSGKADVFVMALNTNASQLLYSGFLGGKKDDFGYAIAVDQFGTAWVAGQTLSTNFPTENPLQASRFGTNDAFLARIQLDQPLVPPTPPVVVQPTLGVALAGDQILLSWSTQASDFFLQQTTNLLSSSAWTTLPGLLIPVVTNGSLTVSLPATNQALFFRLKK